jgi:monothiol glutaredoxin
VKETPAVLFMKGTPDAPQCGFSRAAVQILEMQGVPAEKLKTYNVLVDDQLRSDIKEYRCILYPSSSKQVPDYCFSCYSGWPTIPQLYVNGEFVGGCDILLESEDAFVFHLLIHCLTLPYYLPVHQSGELETLLENNDVIPKIVDSAGTESAPAAAS